MKPVLFGAVETGFGGGWGAELTGGYHRLSITPDISVNGDVDHINLSGFTHVTSEDVRGEWLVSESFPLSIYGGYSRADSDGTGSQDIFFIGVKIYTNDGRAT
jgi:hypothetical protein